MVWYGKHSPKCHWITKNADPTIYLVHDIKLQDTLIYGKHLIYSIYSAVLSIWLSFLLLLWNHSLKHRCAKSQSRLNQKQILIWLHIWSNNIWYSLLIRHMCAKWKHKHMYTLINCVAKFSETLTIFSRFCLILHLRQDLEDYPFSLRLQPYECQCHSR